jgi:hypothetical protein
MSDTILTGAQQTERIRRLARFKALKKRAVKWIETEPKLTDDELRQVAAIFWPGTHVECLARLRADGPCADHEDRAGGGSDVT